MRSKYRPLVKGMKTLSAKGIGPSNLLRGGTLSDVGPYKREGDLESGISCSFLLASQHHEVC